MSTNDTDIDNINTADLAGTAKVLRRVPMEPTMLSLLQKSLLIKSEILGPPRSQLQLLPSTGNRNPGKTI